MMALLGTSKSIFSGAQKEWRCGTGSSVFLDIRRRDRKASALLYVSFLPTNIHSCATNVLGAVHEHVAMHQYNVRVR